VALLLWWRGDDRVNGWLARRSAWQFALIWGSAMFLAWFIGTEVITWPGKGHHIALRYAITTGLFLAAITAVAATYKQRGRREPRDPEL
jgi:hypothetical protein